MFTILPMFFEHVLLEFLSLVLIITQTFMSSKQSFYEKYAPPPPSPSIENDAPLYYTSTLKKESKF